MTFRRVTAGLALAALLTIGGIRAADSDPVSGDRDAARREDRQPVTLRDVLWQMLPDDVRSVSVGPDDRLWLELEGPAVQPAEAKEAIAREFARPIPRLAGLRPVLFESGGRVWFSDRTNRFLLGHDGREWIEKQTEGNRAFIGACTGQHRWERQPLNQVVGGRLFFPETYGVHIFDGRAWSWLETAAPGGAAVSLRLIREADEEGLLLVKEGPVPELWRWRDGAWSRVQCSMEGVVAVCPAPDGQAWLFRPRGVVVTVPLRRGDEGEAEARRLVQQLRAATTADERRVAAQALAATGDAKLLEEQMASSYDPDVLAALTGAMRANRQPAASRLGEFTAAAATLIGHDAARARVLVAVRGAARGDTPLGDGLLVVSGRQPVRFLAAPEIVDAWKRHEGLQKVIFSPDGKGAWVGRPADGTAAFRIDLETGTISDRLPEPLFGELHAVRQDGTVFVSQSSPAVIGCTVAAFRPGRPDDYGALPTESWPLVVDGPGFLGLDAAGGVWAVLADQGLARFYEGRWQPVNVAGPQAVQGMIAGSRGDVILFGSRFGYWRDGEISWAASMHELLAANRAAIAASFGAVHRPRNFDDQFSVAADEAGHVWLLERATASLSVLVGDRWIEARSKLLEAGSRGGGVRCLAAAGGGRVYVSNLLSAHDGGRSFFGAVESGKLAFHDAPHIYEEVPRVDPIRDHQGGLWLPASARASGGTCDLIHGQLAIRIVAGQVDAKLENAGWAAVSDAGGSVWLANARGRSPGVVNLWRAGGPGGKVVIPGWCNGTEDRSAALFSDRPGSVFARTARGLTHFVTAGEPNAYRIAGRYALTGVDGVFTAFACSSEGLLVGTFRRGAAYYDRSRRLVIVRLPRLPDIAPPPAGRP